MTVGKGDLVQEWELRVRAREIWQRDFTDLNREMAGVQGSRIKRFTSSTTDWQTSADKDVDKATEFLSLLSWLDQISESYRRSYERLFHTIQDAQRAYLLSLEEIQRQKEEAALALEKIRDNALVLEDGQRVYFTVDGSQLYDDDGQEITDQDAIEEARAEQERNPNASSHENHTEAKDNFQKAKENENEVFEKLQEFEELKTRMEKGELTEDELNAKAQEIVNGMSPEMRQIYERVQGKTTIPEVSHDDPVSKNINSPLNFQP